MNTRHIMISAALVCAISACKVNDIALYDEAPRLELGGAVSYTFSDEEYLDAYILGGEGYSETERGKIVTKAFIDEGAVQCGFCTLGMIMSSEAILNDTKGKPTEYEVRKGLSGNLCRCTGYDHIVSAVLRASDIAFKEGKNLWQ